jgi:hypothetical protein
MQHPMNTALPYEGHIPIRVVLKFVFLAALGALLIMAQSLALLVLVALGFVMMQAIQERVHKLDAKRIAPGLGPDGLYVGDGGAFPGTQPEDHIRISRPSVIDGGSLERLRH